jgi:putative ABC transport system ATP-binding protein
MVGRPAVVLADEPTGNLDSASGAEVVRLLAGLADEHTTVVVITHNAEVAGAMSRHVRLHDGRIVADERPGADKRKGAAS